MNRENALNVIKEAFSHFIIEENVEIDGVPVYLHIPTLKTIVIGEDAHTNSYLEIVVKEQDNNVGKMINDILLDREFLPMFDTE